MKTIHRLLVWFLLLGVLAAGVLLLYVALLGAPDSFAPYLASRLWRFVAGLAAVVISALAIATALTAYFAGNDRYISFEGSAGTVSISVKAVSEFLGMIGREFAAIRGLQSSITSREQSVEILLDLKIKAGTDIPELCRLLQQQVRDGMRDTIGIADLGAIHIKVREIIADAAEPKEQDVSSGIWQNS